MQILLGADHGGFVVKEKVKEWLLAHKHEVQDVGASSFDPNDDDVVFAADVARQLTTSQRSHSDVGILLCKSGAEMAIAANRFKGVRAVVCHSVEQAKKAREHNDANVLCLGTEFVQESDIFAIISTFLDTHFLGEERYIRRIALLDKLPL